MPYHVCESRNSYNSTLGACVRAYMRACVHVATAAAMQRLKTTDAVVLVGHTYTPASGLTRSFLASSGCSVIEALHARGKHATFQMTRSMLRATVQAVVVI